MITLSRTNLFKNIEPPRFQKLDPFQNFHLPYVSIINSLLHTVQIETGRRYNVLVKMPMGITKNKNKCITKRK